MKSWEVAELSGKIANRQICYVAWPGDHVFDVATLVVEYGLYGFIFNDKTIVREDSDTATSMVREYFATRETEGQK